MFSGKTVGFIPTLGNLHCGHLSLVNRSVRENDITVVSIFVNPTQFAKEEDFLNYPQTLTQDFQVAAEERVDYILAPSYRSMYPQGFRYQAHENEFSQIMEGRFREKHFDGVLTAMVKFFNLIRPTRAYFGTKDYQQYRLVKDMVKSFFIDTKIVRCQTVREKDMLAHSTRNLRLTPKHRELAKEFYPILNKNISINKMTKELEAKGFKVEYIEDHYDRRLAAVRLGKIRLLDNVRVKQHEPQK